eukprot:TRINITY_DN3819_c4_g1_i1.p1 TRINITY_DN3819_c4_g1~~TRINITY_DN3819_c4_g1_i1.p1  ORF type:complete len:313 (+),score=114.19 TRINITY_DN3819_c4_g1_i1:58-996(+)
MSRKKSVQKGAASPTVHPSDPNPLCGMKIRWCIGDGDEPFETDIVVELHRAKLPVTCDNFIKLLIGTESADRKNPRTLTYKNTPFFRFNDFMLQGGVLSKLEQPVRPADGWPAGYFQAQESVLGPVLPDERVWVEHVGYDSGSQYARGTFASEAADERPYAEKEAEACRRHCLQGGAGWDGRPRRFGGFVVKGGKAYFRQQTAQQLLRCKRPAEDCSLWLPDVGDAAPSHTAGTLTMANAGAGTAGSQFSVCVADAPWLDGRHTAFGTVVSGLQGLREAHAAALERCDDQGYVPNLSTAVIVDGGLQTPKTD